MSTRSRVDESGLDSLDLDKADLHDAVHVRRIMAARQGLAAAEQELSDAVAAARESGDAWSVIGLALGTSRQAAYQRFGKAASPSPD